MISTVSKAAGMLTISTKAHIGSWVTKLRCVSRS